MAVRDDFAAGEVLAAADLNDTFASKLPYAFGTATPSTTDSGFLWYDSNSTPPVPKYWNGSSFANLAPSPGLDLITTETFSAVSSLSLNGCFTSTYRNYLIVLDATISSNATGALRWRESGTDNSTANSYVTQGLFADGASVTSSRTTSDLSSIFPVLTGLRNGYEIFVNGPNLASPTLAIAKGVVSASNARLDVYAVTHNQSTAYDGFTVSIATPITGVLRVYGYKD